MKSETSQKPAVVVDVRNDSTKDEVGLPTVQEKPVKGNICADHSAPHHTLQMMKVSSVALGI